MSMGEEADADWEAGLVELGREDAQNHRKNGKGYLDPRCPKCGIIIGNRMMYVCGQYHCPSGLN